jgi:uncharacterized protein YndB with AHSA1/START domain
VSTTTVERRIDAPVDAVFAVVSDPVAVAALSPELHHVRWLDDPSDDPVGARFRGSNRHGPFRWTTTATVTAADAGRRFAYDVTALGAPISTWSFELEPDGAGTFVRQSTTDRRAVWLRLTAALTTGVRDRADHNRRGMEATLDRLQQRLTSA